MCECAWSPVMGSAQSTNATGENRKSKIEIWVKMERYGFCSVGYKTDDVLVQIQRHEFI